MITNILIHSDMYSNKYSIWKITLNIFGTVENIWKTGYSNFGITEIPEAYPFIAKNVPFQTHSRPSKGLSNPSRNFSKKKKKKDLLGFENLFGKNGPFTVLRFQKKCLLISEACWIPTQINILQKVFLM